jgi:hypothetical protein
MPVRPFIFLLIDSLICDGLCVRPCVRACWLVVAYEQSLSEGLRTERRLFHMTFATEDQREGAWNVFWSERAIFSLTLASQA